MWVLIGIGPNDIAVPALVFSNGPEALLKCIEIFDRDADSSRNNRYTWDSDGDDLGEDALSKMYTSYYAGNGGIYRAVLREVPEGTPFIRYSDD
jgi:hypothetical protein